VILVDSYLSIANIKLADFSSRLLWTKALLVDLSK